MPKRRRPGAEAGPPPLGAQREYELARLDLQRELASGVTLNTIRRRYGQPVVDGDDQPIELPLYADKPLVGMDQEPEYIEDDEEFVPPPPPPPPVEPAAAPTWTNGRVHRRGWDVRRLVGKSGVVDEPEDAPTPAQTFMARWARRPRKMKGGRLVSRRVVEISDETQVLIELIAFSEDDPTATSGPRKRVTRRELLLTTDSLDPLVLHWGVAKDDPGEWVLPSTDIWPAATEAVSHMACETPFEEMTGCLPSVDDSVDEDDEECQVIQQLRITLPGEGERELLGVQYVLRNEDGTRWFKDNENHGSNFMTNFMKQAAKGYDEVTDRIVRAEASGNWWSLMHRYNMCRSMLHDIVGLKRPVEAAAKLYVWMRYSSTRHLTWQRSYNVKPRELSAAMKSLTTSVAQVYIENPRLREMARLILGTLGRGGDGGDGQKVRDEILNIMHRNHIKEVKGIWMEEWHQKLHNNTTPDDVIICEAYLAFLRNGCQVHEYWRVLNENGITREHLESFERPIKHEPTPRPEIAGNLIREFTAYLAILRRVHCGADLQVCIDATNKRLPSHVVGLLDFVKARQGDNNVIALIEACVEAREELVDAGLASGKDPAWVSELLYLDLAIDGVVRRAVERADSLDLNVDEQMQLVGLVLENLCLSSIGSNEEMVVSLMEWRRVCACVGGDPEWPLHAKASVDRLRVALSATADVYTQMMQPTAEAIGRACNIESWAVDLFSEEVIRSGPAFALSLLLSRLDPLLREAADMGAWQVISPQPANGVVKVVQNLADWQSFTFEMPTVLVAEHVSGGEEIPAGASAVLTASTVDVLSHASVRARNLSTCFATCYDSSMLDAVRALEGKPVAITVTGADEVTWRETDGLEAVQASGAEAKRAGALELKVPKFGGQLAVPMSMFAPSVVGAKSQNTRALFSGLKTGGLPDWIGLPPSVALPFGTFEEVLEHRANRRVKNELRQCMRQIDTSTEMTTRDTLNACRAAARTVVCPPELKEELLVQMRVVGMHQPPEDDERWEKAWAAITEVWASMWTDRAYISLRNVGCNHANLRMSVLCQRIIPADYAFVIHTVNPSTQDEKEVYAEVVRGLGETLVGNYPGRALSFVADKGDLDSPRVLGYPSKTVGLFVEDTFIFRSDSNGEDLEGYAGAGLFDSVPMDKPVTAFVDYSEDPLVWDEGFRSNLLAQIAKVGVAVENALGSPQDIEGVVHDGKLYVVQTRPQV